MRRSTHAGVAAGCPRSSRSGRRAAAAQQPGDSWRRIQRRGARSRHRQLGRSRRSGGCVGTHRRRMVRGHGWLANDLSPQFAARGDRGLSIVELCGRAQRIAACRAARRDRCRTRDTGVGLAHLVADQGVGAARRARRRSGQPRFSVVPCSPHSCGSRGNWQTERSCPWRCLPRRHSSDSIC